MTNKAATIDQQLEMENLLREVLWKQFGASIDMLKNAIMLWPEGSWYTNRRFFYISYHCLIFLDYYLTIPAENISSPLPFTLVEPGDIPEGAIDDLVPDKIYSKKELLDYLQASRDKCRKVIGSLTEEKIKERWVELPESGNKNMSVLELLLYNMRHGQHHTAQLNLLLRKEINDAPEWVRSAQDDL